MGNAVVKNNAMWVSTNAMRVPMQKQLTPHPASVRPTQPSTKRVSKHAFVRSSMLPASPIACIILGDASPLSNQNASGTSNIQ